MLKVFNEHRIASDTASYLDRVAQTLSDYRTYSLAQPDLNRNGDIRGDNANYIVLYVRDRHPAESLEHVRDMLEGEC